MTDYDRLYDMGAIYFCGKKVMEYHKARSDNDMREPGVEPGCPKAPDPKGGAPLPRPEEKPVNPRFARMRKARRHTAPHGARSSTTKSTTRADGAK